MNDDQAIQKPKTRLLITINVVLWCLYFGISARNSSPFGFVLLVITLVIVLGITTAAQFLLHFVLRRRRIHSVFRVALFFIPTAIVLIIPEPLTPPNKVQPLPSPSRKYVLTVPIECNPNYKNYKVWKVTISDSNGTVLYKDNESECVGWLNAYWAWDDSDRAWLYNSDDGRVYFWELDGANWNKTYWGYGKDHREIERDINQPNILYPYDD